MKRDSKPVESFLPLTPASFSILLALAAGDKHGYAMMHEIAQSSAGTLRLGPGTLYRSIKQLLAGGLIEESGDRPDPGLDDERRRYYCLTAFGRRVLTAEAERLGRLVSQAQAQGLLKANPQPRPRGAR